MLSETDQLVVLADDLRSAFGEVEGERSLVGAEVVDVEDEFFGEVFGGAPDDPAYAWVYESVPIAVSGLPEGKDRRMLTCGRRR